MTGNFKNDRRFIDRLTEIIIANLANHNFGTNELVKEMNMSHSQVHRQLKKISNQSISHFIRSVRLDKAMEMLTETDDTASEISYKVGFGSPAYFNHCFRVRFGFPPGEAKKLTAADEKATEISNDQEPIIRDPADYKRKFSLKRILVPSLLISVLFIGWIVVSVFVKDKHLVINSGNDRELSIAVLPFKNFSDNTQNQYFADGIMEDILNNLFNINALRVVSRTSVEQFRTSNLSVPEIAKLLDVTYVLEGSVRRYDGKIRITVQLIDGQKDQHIWSSGYDRELSDIIGVQGDIALQIANRLKMILSDIEVARIEKPATQNHEAYDYYLRARFLLHKANSAQRADFDQTGVLNCLQYYEKAIEADSTFADAYAGLANAWFNLSAWGILPAYEGFPKAKTYSLKALEYNPDCAEAHAVNGAHLIWGGERRIAEGRQELIKAVELNPNFSTAHQWYAQCLMITGPITEARKHIDKALELEPYFWVVQTLSAWIYYFEKEYDKAIEDCMVARDLNPEFTDNNWLFALTYARLGQGEKMLQELQSIIKKHTSNESYLEELQLAFNQDGINGIFKWLIEVNTHRPIVVEGMDGHPFYNAWWNAILGNKDEAIYWLGETADYPRRLGQYSNLINTNPDFDVIREDTRFLIITERFGLSPAQLNKVH